jgi:hypothetical protein
MFKAYTLIDKICVIIALHAVLTPFLIVGYNPELFAKCKQLIVFFDKKHSNKVVDVMSRQIVIDIIQEQARHFEQLSRAWN